MNNLVQFVMFSFPISEKTHQKLVTETAKGDTLQKLYQISAGWLEHRLILDLCLRPNHHHNSMITYKDGLQQIIVSSILRLEMRKILHQGHLGIEKTKSQVRQSLFWPNMNADITDTILNYEACQQYKNHQDGEQLKNHEIPHKPWTKVGTDLFKIQGRTYLILVNYYSKYFEISKLLNNSSSKVIKKESNVRKTWNPQSSLFSQ